VEVEEDQPRTSRSFYFQSEVPGCSEELLESKHSPLPSTSHRQTDPDKRWREPGYTGKRERQLDQSQCQLEGPEKSSPRSGEQVPERERLAGAPLT